MKFLQGDLDVSDYQNLYDDMQRISNIIQPTMADTGLCSYCLNDLLKCQGRNNVCICIYSHNSV